MIAVGIDIAKAKFDAVVLSTKKAKHKVFDNTTKGFKALQTWLAAYSPSEVHLCLEATNTYGFDLAHFMNEQGYCVSIVNPAQIKAYAESKLSRNKTDKLDATLIAEFCLEKVPRPWQPPSRSQQDFQALYRRWETLKDIRAQELNRLDSERNEAVRTSLESHIAYLEQQLEAVECALDLHLQQDTHLQHQQQLLESIPGIGKVASYCLLAEVPFDLLTHVNELVAFAGLNPKTYSSGKFQGRTKISKVGSARLRKTLYFPAIAAVQHNPLIRPLCQRLENEGKCSLFILCAAMRKLLHLAFGVLKSDKPFDPHYLAKQTAKSLLAP
jgi:transposase